MSVGESVPAGAVVRGREPSPVRGRSEAGNAAAPVVALLRWVASDLRFLGSELRLVYGRRRNIAGLAVLAAVPVLVAVSVEVSPPSGGGTDFFSGILENGLFVALASLTLELPLFLPLAVAVVCGDAVAGEANLGTLRYLLTVPVSRTRLLVVKAVAIAISAASATLLVAATGALLGLLLFGGGQATLASGDVVPFSEVLWRLLLVCAYLTVCLCSLGMVGLFVSTLTEQPVAATIAITSVSTASVILDSIPQLDWLHPYLLTHSWPFFTDLLLAPVPTARLTQGLFTAAVYGAVAWAAAWARLSGRDLTN